jgi:hypothetical protein
MEKEDEGKGVTPAAGVNAATLPFSPQDVAKAIRWRRPGFVGKKSGFTLYWDAYHGNFVISGRGERLAKEWYIIPLYHWSEKYLDKATKDFFSKNYGERFDNYVLKRIEEEGLEQKWAEQYASVMKKMPPYAPCFTKEPDLL